MTKPNIFLTPLLALLSLSLAAQPTHSVTDPEKKYKEVKEFFVKEQYALAYPLVKELKTMYPANTVSDHSYINEDVDYYFIACELKLMQPKGEEDALDYIQSTGNEPRRQIMAFHLAHYYFLKDNYSSAIEYFAIAGYENLSNEQIADAKFEKAYAHFNLKQFTEAKPLFNEIHQLPSNKYYIPANYYYGFISYYDKDYNEALKSFKLVETDEAYQGVVPYYIAEIYYFQGKKDEALRYGESVLTRGNQVYYEKQLKLLMGQLYFEKQDYTKALPLLEDYVNSSDKVSKEVLYELSFCYYKANNTAKAIEGFRQLSNERDSMGQNSMYLLGDLYLKTGDKANARNAFQYSAFNSSNKLQQQVSRFNYAKLSYELGYQDVALNEMKQYLKDYPGSEYDTEAREILINLLANTNNFSDALAIYDSYSQPTASMQKVYPRLMYGRAIEYINDQQPASAGALLTKVIDHPQAGTIAAYAQFWKGEIAYRQQRYDDAIRHLDVFLKSGVPAQGEANYSAARYNTGYAWFQKEQYKNALPQFEAIAKSISSTSAALEQDAYARAADCYYMQKDFAKAGAMYDAIINSALPQADYALYQKGMIAGVKSSADKIRIMNSLAKQYPSSSLLQEADMETALTYIADEKFGDAVPYLNKVIASGETGGLKPRAYLKLGLAYFNNNDNKNALTAYQKLIQLYPQSAEAAEALGSIKDIYVEEGKPDEYIELMRQNGVNVSVTEADSLSYTSAYLKYEINDCAAAINGFNNYLSKYANGSYAIEANYFKAECYQRSKDWTNALAGYDYVNSRGVSRYFEKASLEAARISYFELKDYTASKKYFESLRKNAASQDIQLEALRGLVRTYYQLKDYTTANEAAKELLTRKGISTDDKAIAFLVLGKSQQVAGDFTAAISSFKSAASINKAGWGAEARYEMAACHFSLNSLGAAEKAAMSVIKETGSYDWWVTSAYILLGDIFMKQKDYFNAKATYESVARNAANAELKAKAQQKFDEAVAEEKQSSKISN